MQSKDVVSELFDLTKRCSEAAPDRLLSEWSDRIRSSKIEDLIDLVGRLSTRDKDTSRELKALREAIISEIDRKNAVMIVETMRLLQTSANRLTKLSVVMTVVGIFVALVGAFVGLIGIVATVATLTR